MKQLTISTAVIHCAELEASSNEQRAELLEKIVVASENSDIVLLPAGYFSNDYYNLLSIQKSVTAILREHSSSAIVCVGADFCDQKDQLAYAISIDGVIAAARKFYPTAEERGYIRIADNYIAEEDGKKRTFQVNGFNCYLAVCYDCFGIRHMKINNSGIDICLDLVHGFYRRGYGSSGDVDFARKGFAGASMQWGCPVFGSAVFFGREIPNNWPSGVMWSGAESVKSFKYIDNQMHWIDRVEIAGNEEDAIIYKYIVNK